MLSENVKTSGRIAAAVELLMLAGNLSDDLVGQFGNLVSKAILTADYCWQDKKQLRIYLSMMKKTRTIYFMLYIWASRVTYMKKWMI